MEVQARIRKTTVTLTIDDESPTLASLITALQEKLGTDEYRLVQFPCPGDEAQAEDSHFEVVAERFIVMRADGSTIDDEHATFQPQELVFVLEIFFRTPVPLYRTVKFSQVLPVVPTSQPHSPFSQLVPLYCGSLKYPGEAVIAVPDAERGEFNRNVDVVGAQPCARGLSVFAYYPKLEFPEEALWEEEARDLSSLFENNPGREFSCSVERGTLMELNPLHAEFGYLTPTEVFRDDASGFLRLQEPSFRKFKVTGQDRKSKKMAKKILFCCELPMGTDLTDVGFAAVYDLGEGEQTAHFSLITWPPNEPAQLFPRDPTLDRRSGIFSLEQDSPHYMDECIDRVYYQAFPYLATKFHLHSFRIKAQAGPSPDDFDDEEPSAQARVLLDGLVTLFDFLDLTTADGFADFDALAAAKRCKYNLEEMATHDVSLICHSFAEVINGMDRDAAEDSVQKLHEAHDILGSFLANEKQELHEASFPSDPIPSCRKITPFSRFNLNFMENLGVTKAWDEEVGKTNIQNLKDPTVIEGKAGKSMTGIYGRFYNPVKKTHSFALALYTPKELAKYSGSTAHLRALEKLSENLGGVRFSFCLGFALGEHLEVKKNSCRNMGKEHRSQAMSDRHYVQLVPMLQKAYHTKSIISDDETDLATGMAKRSTK